MGNLKARLNSQIGRIPRVAAFPSQFGPLDAFWIDGREFAHFHDENVLDIRLTRKLITLNRKRLKADDRVILRNSDWLTVRASSESDLSLVMELVKMAANANRRRRGERPRMMPDEEMLARRRKWHRATTDDLAT